MEGPRPPCGFLYPTVDQILVPWLALRQGRILLPAFRGYWRLTEMKMRRCEITPGTPTHYLPFELQEGIGMRVRRRQAEQVRETLQETGLVIWTESDIWLPTQLDRLPWVDHDAYAAMREDVAQKLRRVPLPRSMMRWTIREGSQSLIGTTLSVALRCLRYNGKTKQLRYAGGVSALWIANVCGFSERTAYRGLETLEAMGFLRTAQWQPQWHKEQAGLWRVVTRDWTPPQQRPRRPHQRSLSLPTPAAEPGEDECTKLSPQTCTNLAVVEDSNHNKDMDLRTTSVPQPLRGDKHHSEHTPDVAQSPVAPLVDALPSTPAVSGVCPDEMKQKQTSTRPPALNVRDAPAAPRPDDHTAAEVFEARYRALPADRQAALREEAAARLVQKGYHPDYLTTMLILPEVCHLLAAQVGCAVAPVPLASAVRPPPSPPPEEPTPTPPPHPRPAAPTLRHILLEDLEDLVRLLVLFAQAIEHGLIGKAPADRLTFVAMAVHALRVGVDNPCGLFRTLLHDTKLRIVLSDADDHAARVRLNAHDFGIDPQRRAPPPAEASEPPILSDDARFVDLARRVLGQDGWRGDPFIAVKMRYPAWTRERWDQAVCALDQHQRVRKANRLLPIEDMDMEEHRWPSLGPSEAASCPACGEEGPACAC
jgi:hypothetical protein